MRSHFYVDQATHSAKVAVSTASPRCQPLLERPNRDALQQTRGLQRAHRIIACRVARYDVWLVRNQCGSLRKSGLCGTLYVIMAQAQAQTLSLGICCRRRAEVWFLEIERVRALKQTWHERKSDFPVAIAFPRTSLPFLLACACTVLLVCPLAHRDFLT